MKYAIKTFGCQMNHSDSERVSRVMEDCGFVKAEDFESADIIVINTCSVRQTSENKANGFIKNHKQKCIAVTGCMVRKTGDRETSKDRLLQNENIDIVFRIEDTARLPKLLERYFPAHDFSSFAESFGSGSIENYFRIAPKPENKAQVFVPIMQGCDKFCTYCIVPYARGREVSRPLMEVFSECEKLVEQGALEITLLGQNVNSYIYEGKRCFADLLRKVDTLKAKGLSRIRFTSPHPQDFTDEVIEALAKLDCTCPYIHLPVQHGSDRTLRAMNRNYTVAEYEEIIRKIREAMPNCTIATDIIVGFPGESEEDFQALCDFANRVKFDFSYTAIFSPRRGTPAAQMKDQFIDSDEKKRRFHFFDKLINVHAHRGREAYIGKTLEVLVEKSEKQEDGSYKNIGRSREFMEVHFPSGRPFVGKEVMVTIKETYHYTLIGVPEAGLKPIATVLQ